MNGLADQQGVLAVYPDGLSRSWADGRGASESDQQGVDDVAFIRKLITTLEVRFTLDAHRVYVTGISNGGFMTQRLGCELADKISAIVSVVATLSSNQAASCALSRPLPILYVLSATDSLAAWAKLDGCAGAPATRTLPDRVQDDTHVSETLYASCHGGAQVGLYSVAGGGHTWPSGEQYLPVALVGRTTHQIDNSDLWAILSQFQTP
jgi:polyhydroxybutyrate depolymerase